MSSLLGNIFSLADKTKAGVKSPPTPNTFGEENRPRGTGRERWWGGRGLARGGCATRATGLGHTGASSGHTPRLPIWELGTGKQPQLPHWRSLDSSRGSAGEERLCAETWRGRPGDEDREMESASTGRDASSHRSARVSMDKDSLAPGNPGDQQPMS